MNISNIHQGELRQVSSGSTTVDKLAGLLATAKANGKKLTLAVRSAAALERKILDPIPHH